ncbi:MAG: hypothetical protein NZ805_06290 [Armatimonadetes bacterium]|nr:hypothetical protein [Armatimonadota bacterium]MDW8028597.1 hypothetical protein [Armatimonadota bacterium]
MWQIDGTCTAVNGALDGSAVIFQKPKGCTPSKRQIARQNSPATPIVPSFIAYRTIIVAIAL